MCDLASICEVAYCGVLSHIYCSFSINTSIAAKSHKKTLCEIASVCGLASSVDAI